MNAIFEQVNSAGYAFIEFALPMLIQSSVLILILLLAELLLRKKVRAVFRYWMWMLVLLKLVLPTSLSSPVSLGRWFGDKLVYVDITQTMPEPQAEAVQIGLTNLQPTIDPAHIKTDGLAPEAMPMTPDIEPAVAEPSKPPPESVTLLSWQGCAFLAWLAVLMTMVLLLLQRAVFVRRLVAQAGAASSTMAETLTPCRDRIGAKRTVVLKVSANATSPAVCGLFKPVILVPENLMPSLSANQFQVVLLHELAHIKRHDLWVNLAQTILQIVYFYNPLLWLANAMIRRAREQAVDEMVLVAMGDNAPQYPQTLVNIAKLTFKHPALSLRLIGVVESRNALSGRIKHILSRPIPKTAKLGFLRLLAVTIAATILLPMAASMSGAPELVIKGIVTVGPIGRRALMFDGVDDCLHIPASPTLELKPPFTIEMWIKPDFSEGERIKASGEDFRGLSLLRKGKKLNDEGKEQAGGLALFFLHPSRVGSLYFGNIVTTFSQKSLFGEERSALIAHPGWLHISASCTREEYIPVPDEPLVIGEAIKPPFFLPPFKGQIAEIRIWSKVLNDADSRRLGQTSLTGSEANLVACWNFEHTKGQMAYDISPSRNHAYIGTSSEADDADPVWIDLKASSKTDRQNEVDGKIIPTEQKSTKQKTITGVVLDEQGKSVEGVKLSLLRGLQDFTSDDKGKYEVSWDPQQWGSGDMTLYLVARHEQYNIASIDEIEEDVGTLDIKLKPGVVLSGKVVDPEGKGIAGAWIMPILQFPMVGISMGQPQQRTDSEGNFEIKAIPAGYKYVVSARADGYGQKSTMEIQTYDLAVDGRFDIGVITLPVANLSVAGIVVDANDEPVADAGVSSEGEGQPNHIERTDSDGKFTLEKVCAGRIRINANTNGAIPLNGSFDTYGGANDVKIIVTEQGTNGFVPKQPPSLVGSDMPKFQDLGIAVRSDDLKNRQILLCFWDTNQWSSRNLVGELATREKELAEKNVAVYMVHTPNIEPAKLKKWLYNHSIPFLCGSIKNDAEKVLFSWGVEAQPWLILTDKEGIVRAEGLSIEQLDAKIKEIVPSASTLADSNKVAGLVKDPNGQVVSGVRVTEFQTDKEYTTDAYGRFFSVFEPSVDRRLFFAVDKQHKLVGIGRLPSGERHVEIKLIPAKIVSGIVVDPDGKSVAGAQVVPLPMTPCHVLTDKQGQFDVAWSPSWEPREGLDMCLMVRHVDLNLAALADIARDTENIEIKVTPALTLTGIVEDPNGMPISGAKTSISLIRGWAFGIPVKEAITNNYGHFELYCLPQRQEYGVQAVKGSWENLITTGIINKITDRKEVGSIILKYPTLTATGIPAKLTKRK